MSKSPPIHQLPTKNIQKLPMWIITGAYYDTIQTIQEWMLPPFHVPRFLQKWYKHRRKEYANHWSTTSAKCFDFQGSKWLRHRAVACYVHVLPDWTSGLHFSQEATGLCKSTASRLVKIIKVNDGLPYLEVYPSQTDWWMFAWNKMRSTSQVIIVECLWIEKERLRDIASTITDPFHSESLRSSAFETQTLAIINFWTDYL